MAICCDLLVSRKFMRLEATKFHYAHDEQPPIIIGWSDASNLLPLCLAERGRGRASCTEEFDIYSLRWSPFGHGPVLAFPLAEPDLIRHRTLSTADLTVIERRRGGHNQLGDALQLCAFRYPGRLLRPGEVIPEPSLRFVADQLRVGADVLAAYAARPQTRREQLDGLREAFGFRMFGPGHGRGMLAWLLPVALATTNAMTAAAALMDEFRRRRIVAPGPSVTQRLVAAALVVAERHVAGQRTATLSLVQAKALDDLLDPKKGTSMSTLAWARQPPGAPGHKALDPHCRAACRAVRRRP